MRKIKAIRVIVVMELEGGGEENERDNLGRDGGKVG